MRAHSGGVIGCSGHEGDVVAETLSDLSARPAFYDADKVIFMGLRIATLRLGRDQPQTRPMRRSSG